MLSLTATATLALTAAAIALVPLVSSQSVYVPGDAENAPGASVQEIGVGADGFTSYLVNGVTIAADATNVIATEIGQAGAVVYNCAIGADAQATCSVSQVYDGATYGYTEPVSYFGNAAQATPPAGPSPPTTTAVDPAATSALVSSTTVAPAASTTSAPSSTSIASTTPSAASTSSSSSQNNNGGPQANQPQATSANVFGANSAASKTSSAASILAGCAAMAMLYFAL